MPFRTRRGCRDDSAGGGWLAAARTTHEAGRSLVQVLQAVQSSLGYIPDEAVRFVSDLTGEDISRVFGVLTFYSQFRREPPARHDFCVCSGTACHVNGGEAVTTALLRDLDMHAEGRSADGRFSVRSIACLGACSLSPAMTVNGKVYGSLDEDKIRRIVAVCSESEEP